MKTLGWLARNTGFLATVRFLAKKTGVDVELQERADRLAEMAGTYIMRNEALQNGLVELNNAKTAESDAASRLLAALALRFSDGTLEIGYDLCEAAAGASVSVDASDETRTVTITAVFNESDISIEDEISAPTFVE